MITEGAENMIEKLFHVTEKGSNVRIGWGMDDIMICV